MKSRRRYCQVPKFLSEDGVGRLVHEETYVAVKEREKMRERERAEAARAALVKKVKTILRTLQSLALGTHTPSRTGLQTNCSIPSQDDYTDQCRDNR